MGIVMAITLLFLAVILIYIYLAGPTLPTEPRLRFIWANNCQF